MEQSEAAELAQLRRKLASRYVSRGEQWAAPKRTRPDPKAISCYGLYMPELKETWLRFVDGRPVSAISTRFLEWCCQKLTAIGKKVLVFGVGQRKLAHKPRGSPLDR